MVLGNAGGPHARFQRAIQRGQLWAAETAAGELGQLTLTDALSLTALIARDAPARFERAAVRWHGRYELERPGVGLLESQFALAALAALRGDDAEMGAKALAGLLHR